ncbi:MAG: hypothetical protein AAGG02_21300, partial [Cyanobacteria bacterium P01_H01_bin.15]
KTINEYFNKMIDKRNSEEALNSRTSGNLEQPRSDYEILMDDMIIEKKEKEENARAERGELLEREQRLITAGNEIRNRALTRRVSEVQNGETISPEPKRTRLDLTSDLTHIVSDQIQRQEEYEKHKLDLDERRFEFEQQKSDMEQERYLRSQTLNEQRFQLDRDRFEADQRERRQRVETENEERREDRKERRLTLELINSMMQRRN